MSMKHIAIALTVAAAAATTGCQNMAGMNHQITTGSLDAEPLRVMSREQEFGVEVVGNASGTAENRKFLFFTIGGDRIDASLPMYGSRGGSQLERLASLRAARSQNGDAFYLVTTETEKANILWIYRREKVSVSGKALRTKDLGTISAERADDLRKTAMTGHTEPQSAVSTLRRWLKLD